MLKCRQKFLEHKFTSSTLDVVVFDVDVDDNVDVVVVVVVKNARLYFHSELN